MRSTDVAVLRGAALPTLAAGATAVAVGAAVVGTAGAVGAAVGAVVVVVFFAAGQLALGAVLRADPQLALSAALALYLFKIGVLFGLLLVLKDTTAFDTKAFALSVLACTLVWTAAEVVVFGRTRMLVVEPGSGPGGPSGPAPGRAAGPGAQDPGGPRG